MGDVKEKKEYVRPKLFSRPAVAKFGDKPKAKQKDDIQNTGWKSAKPLNDGERGGISIGRHREEKNEWKTPDSPQYRIQATSLMGAHRKKKKYEAENYSTVRYDNGKDSLDALKGELGSSQKGGLFGSARENSKYYERVSNALDTVLGKMNVSLEGDVEEVWEKTQQIGNDYDQLIQACEVYCGRNPFTSKGKARQQIVGRIMEQAKEDRAKLSEYFSKMNALPPKDRAKSLAEALDNGRRLVLKLPKNHKKLGGAASEVLRFKTIQNDPETDEAIEKNVYFKGEESVDFSKMDHLQEHALEILAEIQEQQKLPFGIYSKIVKLVSEETDVITVKSYTNSLNAMPEYNSNVAVHRFVNTFHDKACAYDAVTLNLRILGLGKDKGTYDLSLRNVAASRFAKLLGVGELIVDTEKTTLNMNDGVQKKGILMQEAKGEDAADARNNIIRKAYLDQDDRLNFDATAAARKAVTGKFQKSMADLQVLDALMSQGDRHAHNFMVDSSAGDFGTVQGIDNDFSFGTLSLYGKNGFVGNYGRSPINEEGKMSIPYMSEQLKNGIIDVTREELYFALQDVLRSEEIEACWKRICQMQIAILLDIHNYQSLGGTNRYLNDDEWNEETLKAFEETGDSTYLGGYLAKAKPGYKNSEIYKAGQEFWETNIAEFNFKNVSEIEEVLSAFCRGMREYEYIQKSGLLRKWCMESGGKPFSFSNLPEEMQKRIGERCSDQKYISKLAEIG